MRRLAGWLVVLPFVLFSLILPGVMPTRDAMGASGSAGGIRLVLCSGAGPIEMVMAADGTLHPADTAPDHQHAACDWAPHAQALWHGTGAVDMPLRHDQARIAQAAEAAQHLHHGLVVLASARDPPFRL